MRRVNDAKSKWEELEKIAKGMTDEQKEQFYADTAKDGKELSKTLQESPFGALDLVSSMLDILEDNFTENQLGAFAMAWLTLRFNEDISLYKGAEYGSNAAEALFGGVKKEWDKSKTISEKMDTLTTFLKATERTVGKIIKDETGVDIGAY